MSKKDFFAILSMMKRFFQKYLFLFYLISVITGSLHHHSDLKQHNDCKVCVVKNSVQESDTPPEYTFDPSLTLSLLVAPQKSVSFFTNQKPQTLKNNSPPNPL